MDLSSQTFCLRMRFYIFFNFKSKRNMFVHQATGDHYAGVYHRQHICNFSRDNFATKYRLFNGLELFHCPRRSVFVFLWIGVPSQSCERMLNHLIAHIDIPLRHFYTLTSNLTTIVISLKKYMTIYLSIYLSIKTGCIQWGYGNIISKKEP